MLITPELDDRIRASLHSATQETADVPDKRQPASFWWASSLTGVAATLVIVAIINVDRIEA